MNTSVDKSLEIVVYKKKSLQEARWSLGRRAGVCLTAYLTYEGGWSKKEVREEARRIAPHHILKIHVPCQTK